jgi:Tannase and feruloyl esterase
VSVLLSIVVALPVSAATCDTLRTIKLTNVVVRAAEIVSAGEFVAPDPSRYLPSGVTRPSTGRSRTLPAFCRVKGTIRPSNDSNIEFELWLPMSAWNGRYFGVENGGAGGSIAYEGTSDTPGLVEALKDGFATSATDSQPAVVTSSSVPVWMPWSVGAAEMNRQFISLSLQNGMGV